LDVSSTTGKRNTKSYYRAVSVAIQDAIALIQQMEAYGYFGDTEEEDSDDLPQHSRGPAG
jgi:hypothetical protein